MGLATYFSELEAARRTVTVYADEPRPELGEHFEHWNVDVEHRALPEGTADAFVTVHRGDEFLGGADLDSLSFLREPTLTRPGTRETPEDNGQFVELLDDTLFRAVDRRALLATSREFEDRAWRAGEGTLHAAFQRAGAFEAQRSVYEQLAEKPLDIHVYVAPDWGVPTPNGVTVHADDTDELGAFWVVAYESENGIDDCALIAEERERRSYAGFWTYDAERVADVTEHLRSTYW